MNDGHIDHAHQREQRGRPIAPGGVLESRAQRHHADVEKYQDELRREPRIPGPVRAPHRPAPQRSGGQGQQSEGGADGRGCGGNGVTHFDAPDERDGGGHRHADIGEERQPGARHMHIDDPKRIALLIVRRREYQAVHQPIADGDHGKAQEPRCQRRRGAINVRRRCELVKPGPHNRLSSPYSSVICNAAVAANGASVHVNTQSAARKYKAPAALTPEIARSVAPAPKISSGMASGNTISDNSTLPRFRPTVRPAPVAPSQLKVKVPKPRLSIIVANAAAGIPKAVPTTGDTSTSARPVTSQ